MSNSTVACTMCGAMTADQCKCDLQAPTRDLNTCTYDGQPILDGILDHMRELSRRIADIEDRLSPPVKDQEVRTRPVRGEHYHPQEQPRMYPLELGPDLHICLWDTQGEYKWTIAYFVKGEEGYDLQFIGDRPLDERVNWEHFQEIIRQGQALAYRRFRRPNQQ